MVDEVEKRKPGRPKGSRTYRPDAPLPSKRMRDLMAGAYSDAEWLRRYKLLPVTEQFRLRGGAEPKPRDEQPPGSFTLIVTGLGAVCPECGHRSAGAPVVKNEEGGKV